VRRGGGANRFVEMVVKEKSSKEGIGLNGHKHGKRDKPYKKGDNL